MVKLNEDAFAAVNAAFPDVSKEKKTTAITTTTTAAAKRKGVGATVASSDLDKVGEADIHKRILNVGNKRRKKLEEEEEDEDVGTFRSGNKFEGRKPDRREVVENRSDDDGDEEEDVGRTAISGSSAAFKSSVPDILPDPTQKKKKKKLGKKERQAQKETEKEPVNTLKKDTTKEVLCGQDESGAGASTTVDGDAEGSKNKKRKRPKVRSRQKNIRKDNRVTKPSHLIPGSTDYKGRPLTAETRRKLNLPESRRESKLKSYWSGQEKSSDSAREH